MKKYSFILVLLITIFYSFNVYAIDNVVSMNKYDEEKFIFTEKSYNEDNNVDGIIAGGYVLKEVIDSGDEKYNDYQAIVVKYDNSSKLVWSYIYGKTDEDYLDYLNYSYDNEGNIDGYLLVVKATNDIGDPINNESIFIKLSLDGKKVFDKPLNINNNIRINKLLKSGNDGYIAIGNNGENSYLIKLDKELNVTWFREQNKESFNSIKYNDLVSVYKDNQIIGYTIIKELENNEGSINQLVRYNSNGEEPVIIVEDLKYDSFSLEEAADGFVLYGSTSEVKLKKGTSSYYLINYNSNNEIYWETVGEDPLDKDKNIKLLPRMKDNIITEYLLLYSNNVDKSTEVVKIMADGTIKNKIKKIYDEYYTIEDFDFYNDVLYLVGQINCPKDDTCEYDSNSLFLTSDEEKVVEVKDNDSRNILIVTGLFILLIVGTVLYRRRKVVKKKVR